MSVLVSVLKDVLDFLLVLALGETELECDCAALELLAVHPVDRLLRVLLPLVLKEREASVQVVRVVQREADRQDLPEFREVRL